MKTKKYHVIDAEGEEYQVEELDEEIDKTEIETTDDEPAALSPEEIDALKKLAGVADKLIAMIQANDSDEDMDEDNLVDEDETEEDIIDEGENEEVIDTDEEEKNTAHDSKKSFGSLERKRKITKDNSLVDEVSDAWAKRYGGKK